MNGYNPEQRKKAVINAKMKCLVLGAAGAGKTSLLRRYFYKTFEENFRNPTLGSDFYVGRATHKDRHVSLQMWDTPGRERFALKRPRKYAASFSDTFFRHADAVMLVYDMTSSTSFTQLLKWYADLMELFKDEPLPMLIVANKLDLFTNEQQRAPFHPRRVPQRDVLGLGDDFRGKDFRYEYRVSPIRTTKTQQQLRPTETRNPMEISTFLANRENWTTDGSYLDSLLNSEDASHPDREMVLLWCMRNGLQHVEVSAATGEGVDEAVDALVTLVLERREKEETNGDKDIAIFPPRRQHELDLMSRYAPENPNCFLASFRYIRKCCR